MNGKVLLVDDGDSRDETADLIRNSLGLEVKVVSSFVDGRQLIEQGAGDVLVLDIRDDSGEQPDREAGVKVFEQVCATRFLPVVVFSGYASTVSHLSNPPMVHVVDRAKPQDLLDALQQIGDSKAIEAALEVEVKTSALVREQLWREVSLAVSLDGSDDVHERMLRRAARALESAVSADTGSNANQMGKGMYLYPPIDSKRLHQGALVRLGAEAEWFILLTPECDLQGDNPKASQVLLANATPMLDVEQLAKFCKTPGASRGELSGLLNGSFPRYLFLPRYREIPDLLVDLQRLSSKPFKDVSASCQVAVLDRPYAEALAVKLAQYLGRVGTPDFAKPDIAARIDDLAASFTQRSAQTSGQGPSQSVSTKIEG